MHLVRDVARLLSLAHGQCIKFVLKNSHATTRAGLAPLMKHPLIELNVVGCTNIIEKEDEDDSVLRSLPFFSINKLSVAGSGLCVRSFIDEVEDANDMFSIELDVFYCEFCGAVKALTDQFQCQGAGNFASCLGKKLSPFQSYEEPSYGANCKDCVDDSKSVRYAGKYFVICVLQANRRV